MRTLQLTRPQVVKYLRIIGVLVLTFSWAFAADSSVETMNKIE